ncbi:MAG: hypothetical protein EOR57_05755 [Mesorhizobium sp.]|uniref:hypothetical protein n=1 Tax=Mesorhizobium sp. TaxID=1871066 RepID=UPI000FE90B52|nr:hypothetical protein [Mesorhizobium sp.]RWL21940.1 MAG: hypothetical protein EOR57_05755 [Mesorhizobium sp.]
MAQARTKPVVAKAKNALKNRPAAKAAANPDAVEQAMNQTETPEATIRRLAGEVKKFSDWWHEDRRKMERLEHRQRALEGTLRAISNLARIDVGDFVERCDRGSPYDDSLPF